METFLSLFDDKVELEIEVDYDAVHQPAFVAGPPEDCYPDESSMTVIGFKVLGMIVHDDDFPAVTDEVVQAAWDAAQDRIYVECWGDFYDRL